MLIEPNHELSISLQNKYSNDQRVHIIDKGVDYRNDNVNFHIPKEGHSHGNFSSHLFNSNSKTKKISTTTIDKIFYEGNFDFIDLLKLDLEGFDYYALLGARKCIAQKKIRVIQFEITRSWEHSGASPCAALRFLNNAGYEIFILRPDSLEALININDMTHFSHYCNIIAILNSA